jgi:hypothetical protein
MPEYDNRNRFTLFKNTKKREGKQDADWNGTFTDESGREFWINAWVTRPKNNPDGDKFLSGSVRLKDAPREQPRAPAPKKELEDEIPF